MKSTIKFLVMTMLLMLVITAFAGCSLFEHTWTEATCTAPKTCTGCGATEGEALGHTEQIIPAKEATCYETGLTEGKICSVCNEVLVEQKVVLSLGHDMVIDLPATATCTQPGLTAGAHCSRCDYKEEQTETPALGHSYMFPCDAHCQVCGELSNENATHTIVAVAAKAATCTATGNVAYWYCSDCGAAWADEALTQLTNQKNVVIPELGHAYMYPCDAHCMACGELTNPNAAHTIVAVAAKAATCTANGNVAYWYCSDCGAAWADEALTQVTNRMNVVIPALGHSYMFACDAHCMVCGELTNPNAAHTINFVEGYAATCTANGMADRYECSICGYCWLDEGLTLVANRMNVIIPASGHNWELGSQGCTLCGEEYVLNGSGTETDPYTINNLFELVFFRNAINANSAKYNVLGTYYVLGADIDLAGQNWVAIGSAYADHGFMGNFDGNGFKIKNLTITNPALDSDGYAYAAFFGVTEGIDEDNQNFIKNLVIENVTIETSGHIVAAAIAYPYYTALENITVCGDIAIKGGDYTAGALAYTRRCVDAKNITVSGNEGSYINGARVVGGVISDIQMNGGLKANYANFAASNLTITGTQMVGGISGILASQTLDGATVKNVALTSGDSRVGIVAGSFGGTCTVKNIVSENVTGATVVIGATYDKGAPVAAKIGDTYYATLEAALAAANGETIVLVGNVALAAPITIAKDDVVVIDLAGFVLSYESTTMNEAMITNLGSLTIKDSGKTGEIFYNYVGAADPSYGKGNYTISNAGTLVIDGGKIHIATLRQHAKYPVNNNSTSGNATLIVNGGHLYNYNTSAIRMFCNSTTYTNTVIINGGLIEGYSAIWMQNPGKNTVNGQLTINGGEIRTTAAAYVNGSATVAEVASKIYCTIDGEGGAWDEDSFVKITGGLFNENVYLETKAPAVVEIGEGATFNGYVKIHVHEFVGHSCETDGVCSCGAIKPAAHTLKHVAAVEAINCQATGNEEYWECTACGACFGDADGISQLNPAWIFFTGECVRPEGAADCAIVPCTVCGEDTYGQGDHDTGVAACQNGLCSKCGAEIEGYGCQNYDTPACEDGFCFYCGGPVKGFGHENGAWAPCLDGECSYGCGLKYPATEDHVDADGDDYCEGCWNHLKHDVDPCLGGECSICWTYIEGAHTYTYPCDQICSVCYELTNPDAAHTIVAVEAKAATCTANGNVAYWYCSDCGAAWANEELTQVTNQRNVIIPALGHADENGDYKCDNCSTKMLPADGTALTIPQALAIAKLAGSSYTTQKYYITGIVTGLYNTTYGNLYLKDAEGNQICIYGLYTWNKAIRYDKMDYKPVNGDELTVYTVLGTYNSTAQGKDAWVDEVVAHEHNYVASVKDPTCTTSGYTTHACSICGGSYTDSEVEALGHTTDNGTCDRCGLTFGGDEPVIGTLAEFTFGANGSASHADPSNKFSNGKSYTVDGYTLTFTSATNCYDGGHDAKGNSCMKMGTSKAAGSFTVTVADDVTEVVIYVAQYKANTTKISVNGGTAQTITTASNNGAYTAITIDTSVNKTFTFATVSGGVRCMIDTIVFNGIVG